MYMKVLIVDDHTILRQGLRQILADEFAGAFFGEAATASQALQQLSQKPWDVVLLDITLPGRSGLEVLKDIKTYYPKVRVLVLTMHPEEQFAVRALKSGADGYLTKHSATEELVAAVKKMLGGGKYISLALAEQLVTLLRNDTDRPLHEQLSDREYQVMRLLAAGMPVTKIADKLALSVQTISTYRRRILEKMQMQTNSDLTRYALVTGLLDESRNPA
jgi:two-component system, NarL family, invasion response regulator UvrY